MLAILHHAAMLLTNYYEYKENLTTIQFEF
jgi:hypothetical protein